RAQRFQPGLQRRCRFGLRNQQSDPEDLSRLLCATREGIEQARGGDEVDECPPVHPWITSSTKGPPRILDPQEHAKALAGPRPVYIFNALPIARRWSGSLPRTCACRRTASSRGPSSP